MLASSILPKNHPDLAHYKTIDFLQSLFKKLYQSDQSVNIMKVQSFIIVDLEGLDQVFLYKMQDIDGSGRSYKFGSDWN